MQSNAVPSGFRPEFRDRSNFAGTGGNNSDQTHHFAAFLQFGYLAGGVVGDVASLAHEVSLSGKWGDARLGSVAAEMGADLRSGAISPLDLGNRIRRTLCDPNWH